MLESAFRRLIAATGPLLALVLLLCFAAPVVCQEEADYLFGDSTVYEYRLYFEQPDFWDSLTSNYGVLDEEYMPCDLVFEDSTYPDIGVRFKGNSSYHLYPGNKKSFKLDFNRYQDSQTFFGLKKINLNNGFMDPTQIREKLFLDVLEEHVPCIRAAFARLYINDVYWGLYTVIEQPDKTFLESRFGVGEEGNLFKGDPAGDLVWYGSEAASYYSLYELKTNELENDWTDLIHLIDVLNNTSDDSLRAALTEIFDVRNYLTFQALNNMFVNLDSYYGSGHNYYVYHKVSSDRFIHLPWDVNEAFGTFGLDFSSVDILTHDLLWTGAVPAQRPLSARLLANGYFVELYMNLVHYLMDHQFDAAQLHARIDHYRLLIATSIDADPHRMFTYAEFEQNMNLEVTWGVRHIPGLTEFIAGRRGSIGSQLWMHPPTGRLFINEFMASNGTTLADAQGEFDDWIELYNDNLFPVRLDGYFLTDDFAVLDKWSLPDTVVEAGGYLLVWADDDTDDGPLHAGFKLGASGEEIALVNSSVGIVDSLTFGQQQVDVAFGRFPDGDDSLLSLVEPTPGKANRLPANRPPVFVRSVHTPDRVASSNLVQVLTRVGDESSLSQVSLFYDVGAGFIERPMFDDGLHGDSADADSVYGATIPASADSTIVAFYITATDDSGAVVFDPPGWASAPYRYRVGEVPPSLFINEFMASNDLAFQDPQGEFDDWIELFNRENFEVNVSGMYLTDDFSELSLFALPDTTIAAGGFLVVWADGDVGDAGVHANFKLGASGEQLGLFSSHHTSIDSLTFGLQHTDSSFGRIVDGGDEWTVFESPTPGFANTGVSCCSGATIGDIDCSGTVDITDVQVLLDHLFLTLAPLCCGAEANVNYPGSGSPWADSVVNITDLQMLAENLFITLESLPSCP